MKIYLEKILPQNAAGQEVDNRTINSFRSQHLKNMIGSLFVRNHSNTYPAKKIEAEANKYSFMLKKATTSFEEKLKGKIQETIQHIQEVAESELIH